MKTEGPISTGITDRLAIAIVHARDLKAISATVEQALEDHYLSDIAHTSTKGPDATA